MPTMKRFKARLSRSGQSSKTFRFFDLPQELRDKVYDYLVPAKQWETVSVISWPLVTGSNHIQSPDQRFQRAHLEHFRNLPTKKLLLICRRMRQEILKLVLLDAWFVVRFFVDADVPPVLSDKVLNRTIAKYVRQCKLQFTYRNLLGKLRPGASPAQLFSREEKISCHLGIAINSVVRRMASAEVCTYQLTTNHDFDFNIHHDCIIAASAHFLDHGRLSELRPAGKTKKSIIDILEKQKSSEACVKVTTKPLNEPKPVPWQATIAARMV